MSRFKRYLSAEIGIEFKACLYFYVIIFFYGIFTLLQGGFEVNIFVMAEMILATYLMGYIQVFLLDNFDEAEEFKLKGILLSVLCSIVYAAASYILKWFDRNIYATGWFFLYIMFSYVCVFFVYKIKRDVDTKQLNEDLQKFKERKG